MTTCSACCLLLHFFCKEALCQAHLRWEKIVPNTKLIRKPVNVNQATGLTGSLLLTRCYCTDPRLTEYLLSRAQNTPSPNRKHQASPTYVSSLLDETVSAEDQFHQNPTGSSSNAYLLAGAQVNRMPRAGCTCVEVGHLR